MELLGNRWRKVERLSDNILIVEDVLGQFSGKWALKFIKRSKEEKRVKRFEQEVRALQRLKGEPNIVPIVDDNLGSIDSPELFYVMPLAPFGDLARLGHLFRGQLGLALVTASQICDGLSAAHRAGIVHRDVKPANVLFLQSEYTPALADFGIALMIEPDERLQITSMDEVVGPKDFRSPEQETEPSAASERSDLYSLGKTIYWMLTGRYIRRESFPRLVEVFEDKVYAPVDALLERLIIADPAQRMASAASVKQAITEILSPPPVFSVNTFPDTERKQLPAVSRLIATPGDRQVVLDWSPVKHPDFGGYTVRWSNTEDGQFKMIEDLFQDSSYTHSKLENGRRYYYRVAARDVSGFETRPAEAWALPRSHSGVFGRIVYATETGLVLRDLSTGATSPLIQGEGLADPIASPDGSAVIYTGLEANSNWEVLKVGLDGKDLTRLTYHPASDRAGCWSPDGEKIFFTSERTGRPMIYLMNKDGTDQQLVCDFPGTVLDISPDGRTLLCYKSDSKKVLLLDLQAFTVTPVLKVAGCRSGRFSPHGQSFVITILENEDSQQDRILVANALGREVRDVSPQNTQGGAQRFVCWSPDSARLMYASDEGSFARLWRLYVLEMGDVRSFQLPDVGPVRPGKISWIL